MIVAEQKIRRLRGVQKRQGLAFNGTMLKIYGCIAMLCYSVGTVLIHNGLLQGLESGSDELATLLAERPELLAPAAAESVLQLLGGLCVPVFAFLLVEGFLHTSDFKRYFFTMLATACISEVPYDMAMRGNILDFQQQNLLFTLTVGLLMLYGLRMFEGKEGVIYRVDQVIVVIAALLWSGVVFNSDYGLCMILLIAVYYLLREKKLAKILIGCAISIMYITAPISGFFLYCYNGERGWNKNKYVFYALYPLHLLVLMGIGRYLQ